MNKTHSVVIFTNNPTFYSILRYKKFNNLKDMKLTTSCGYRANYASTGMRIPCKHHIFETRMIKLINTSQKFYISNKSSLYVGMYEISNKHTENSVWIKNTNMYNDNYTLHNVFETSVGIRIKNESSKYINMNMSRLHAY